MSCRSAIAALLLAGTTVASAETYRIDPAHSKIAFSVPHLLGTARGEFHQFSGTIAIDRAAPERSSVEATIQVASIDTAIRKRDEHLLSAEFFDARKHPTITFRSREVKRTGATSGDVVGELTIKGLTRPLTLHVELLSGVEGGESPRRTRWRVTSESIRRKDFGLVFAPNAERISGIGQQVTPAIEIEAVRE